MKKILLILAVMLFTSCNTTNNETDVTEITETRSITEEVTEEVTEEWVPDDYRLALKKADGYLSKTPMSRNRLFMQLTHEKGEGLSDKAAMYAINNVDTDWEENNRLAAENIRDLFNMRGKDLYHEITNGMEKMTHDEAIQAMEQIGESYE